MQFDAARETGLPPGIPIGPPQRRNCCRLSPYRFHRLPTGRERGVGWGRPLGSRSFRGRYRHLLPS
jgi:hypothetical protein